MAFTPNSLQALAIDWPWLPEDAVITPSFFSSSVRLKSRLMPPRPLKAPRGRYSSCFKYTSASKYSLSPEE